MLVRSKTNVYCYLGVLAFALWVLWMSLQLDALESRIMPICICCTLIFLDFCAIIQEFRTSICVLADEKPKAKVPMLFCVLYVLGMAIGIWLLGFYAAALLFIFSYIKANGGSWKQSLLTAAIATIVLYVVFPVLLQVDLYSGLIFELFNR